MPSIEKRGDNYRIVVSMGYGLDGKQIRKTTTFTPPVGVSEGKAAKLATAYAYEFERQCRGLSSASGNMRFSELCEWYFTQVAVYKLKPSTYDNHRYVIHTYILPYIGNMKLKDITTVRIDQLFHELFKNGRRKETYRLREAEMLEAGMCGALARRAGVSFDTVRNLAAGGAAMRSSAEKIASAMGVKLKDMFVTAQVGGGLDEGTLRHLRSALSPIFSTAVKKEMLLKNPVTNATLPSSGIDKERVFLNAEQCKELMSFLGEMPNPQMPRIIKFLLFTGLRIGELTGLLWENVDYGRNMLVVKHTVSRRGGEYILSTPKTKKSRRVVAMPPQVIEILREQKAWQEERKKAVGERWVERGVVFHGKYGEFMNSNYVGLAFRRLLEGHPEFPQIHLHDLRHANASLLINMGVPVKIISEHLGHGDTRITEAIYAHVFEETMTVASDAISRALAEL